MWSTDKSGNHRRARFQSSCKNMEDKEKKDGKFKETEGSCWTSTAFEISRSRSWTSDMLPHAENKLAKNGYKLLS